MSTKTGTAKPRASATKSTAKSATKASSAPPAAPDASLRKKELVDAVVARSGVKKKDARPVIDAMLAHLGEALAAGKELNLPPLGRIKINREKPMDDGRVIILKLRQKDQPPQADATPASDT